MQINTKMSNSYARLFIFHDQKTGAQPIQYDFFMLEVHQHMDCLLAVTIGSVGRKYFKHESI